VDGSAGLPACATTWPARWPASSSPCPAPPASGSSPSAALVCHVLSDGASERLRTDHPAAAIELLSNLARELSRRVRRADRAICALQG
jgi:hypothetical protein